MLKKIFLFLKLFAAFHTVMNETNSVVFKFFANIFMRSFQISGLLESPIVHLAKEEKTTL